MQRIPDEGQILAAIGLLKSNQKAVAEACGLGLTLNRHLTGKSRLDQKNMQTLLSYFDREGLEFVEDGVRRKRDYFTIHRGPDGFKDFMNHVYRVAKTKGGRFCIYNAKPSNWVKWLGEEWNEMHSRRMAELLGSIEFRITSQNGDTNFLGNRHAEYRWIPDELWHDQAIYVYGDFIGFMIFKEDSVAIKVLKDHEISEHMLRVFDHIWKTASIIPEGLRNRPEG